MKNDLRTSLCMRVVTSFFAARTTAPEAAHEFYAESLVAVRTALEEK